MPLYRLGQWLIISGQLFDLSTTTLALDGGCREANPLYGRQPRAVVVVTVKAGATIGTLWGLHTLAGDHPTLATWLGIGIGSGMVAAGVHNVRQMGRCRR